MLIIHKSCRSFDVGDGNGRQDLSYDIQQAIDDGLKSLLLVRNVLSQEDTAEEHEFLAMFGTAENYDAVLDRVEGMLEAYHSKKIKINITCGRDWIAELWDHRNSDRFFTGDRVDMTVPHWREARRNEVRPAAVVPPSIVKTCSDPHDLASEWWTPRKDRYGVVLKANGFRGDRFDPKSGSTIDEIDVQDETELDDLDCLTATILHEVSHTIHLFGSRRRNAALQTDDVGLDLDNLYWSDAAREARFEQQLQKDSAPNGYSQHHASSHTRITINSLNSAFHVLSLGDSDSGQETGSRVPTMQVMTMT